MRLFIAIPLPKSFKKEVSSVQRELRSLSTAGRFVPGGNFHITLHFIGESDDLRAAAAAMHEAARGIRPFNLHLAGYDSFSKKDGESRTAVLKVGGELGELNALYESLESALFDQGFSREHKRFVPHITLGRNVQYAPENEEKLRTLNMNASLCAQSIVLYESIRERDGMVYLPVHTEKF